MIFEYVKIANEHGGFGLVDDLHMSYNGNRLTSVRDDASHLIYAAATDFGGNPRQVYKLTYNTAGSLVSDEGRNIAKIEYDNLGNPIRIQFTNGNVTKYVYSATGEKLQVIYQTAVPNISVAIGSTKELTASQVQYTDSIDYLLGGSLTLRNGRIDQYQFEEGYCQAEVYSSTIDKFTFCYYDQDHLGNIRQVTKADGSTKGKVIQKVSYYPFGLQLCDGTTDSNVQSHKYNGKELDKMHGLNTYDYGARQYNPVTARWDRIDPLAEKYYSISPYAYCAGNPVKYVDPDGRAIFYLNGSEFWNDKKEDGKIYFMPDDSNKEFKKGIKAGNTDAITNCIEFTLTQSNLDDINNIITKDDGNGKGKTPENSPSNFQEFGGYIGQNGKVQEQPAGPVTDPYQGTNAEIKLKDGYSTFHTHPSGWVNPPNNDDPFGGGGQTIQVGAREPGGKFIQTPSDIDKEHYMSNNLVHYVFGRRNKKTYICKKINEVVRQATIDTSKFMKLRK